MKMKRGSFLRLILLLSFILISMLGGCSPYPMDREHVERWDLTRPEFSNVKMALEHNNPQLAAKSIVRYYDERKEPAWPFSIDQIKADEAEKKFIVERAERLLEHNYTFLNQTFKLGPIIPWTKNPSNNFEWLWELNRHYWWVILGRAYRQTGDERYARLFVNQVTDWIKRNPPIKAKNETSPTWRLLETGLRLSESWIKAYCLFLPSPSMTWQVKWQILQSIHDHAEFLSKYQTARNHLLMESNGLASAVAYFPEFKQAKNWENKAFSRLSEELNRQVFPDGVHFEGATHYQWTCAQVFEKSRALAVLCGNRQFQEEVSRVLRQMYYFLAWIIRPDGLLPMINDGTEMNATGFLVRAAEHYKDDFLLYAATAGEEGLPPPEKTIQFPFGGFTISRTGWQNKSIFMVFDHGPLGGDHGHEDFLNFELWAYGTPVLVDPGTFTYDFSDPFRQYFLSSASHNLVLVDGHGQARRYQRADPAKLEHKPSKSILVTDPLVTFTTAVYKGNLGTDSEIFLRDVTHRRMILFVDNEYFVIADFLHSPTSSTFTQHFQIAPGIKKITINEQAKSCILSTEDLIFRIVPFMPETLLNARMISGERDPIGGWYSSDYNKRIPASTLEYQKKEKSNSAVFFTLLIPKLKSKRVDKQKMTFSVEPLLLEGKQIPLSQGACLKLKKASGCDLIVISDLIDGEKKAFQITSPEHVALFRYNNKGKGTRTFQWTDRKKDNE